MEVYYECYKCKTEQLAKDVTEEVPSPVSVTATCPECGHKNLIFEQARQKWLEDRGFEVKNTSHPLWHVKDVKSLDDLQFEFTLVYQVHHKLCTYQVGYYSNAIFFFQKWALNAGFKDSPRFIKKVTVSYDHTENNTRYFEKKGVVGHYGTEETAEKGIQERMTWKGYEWLTREHFEIEEIDTQ